MRGRKRSLQKVWWVEIEELKDGIDTTIKYGKPKLYWQSVSATSGTPEEISAGIIPNYDRYVTSYDRRFSPEEGMQLFVDREPQIDSDENLVMDEDGITPITLPDYRMVRILDTKRGNVARYGISKIGGNQ